MPNHVENDLTISGNLETINNLLERYHGETILDADRIIPYPENFRQADKASEEAMEQARKKQITFEQAYLVKDGFNHGGYEWCIQHWGTKWGMYEFTPLVKTSDSVRVGFQSAWEPPLPLIEKMSEDFPELIFRLTYFDDDAGFMGVYKVQAGAILKDDITSQ